MKKATSIIKIKQFSESEEEAEDGDMEVDHSADEEAEEIAGPSTSQQKPEQKEKIRKKGIIYISSIPKHMNVAICRELMERFGEVGRIFLQPDSKGSKLLSMFFYCKSNNFNCSLQWQRKPTKRRRMLRLLKAGWSSRGRKWPSGWLNISTQLQSRQKKELNSATFSGASNSSQDSNGFTWASVWHTSGQFNTKSFRSRRQRRERNRVTFRTIWIRVKGLVRIRNLWKKKSNKYVQICSLQVAQSHILSS